MKMKAALLIQEGAQPEIHEVDVPEIEESEVLIKVRACGTCKSDVGMIYGYIDHKQFPFIPGHEPMGVVADVGKKVQHLQQGMRVAVDPIIHCGMCKNCLAGKTHICLKWRKGLEGCGSIGRHLDGGWAEYVKAPGKNCIPIPDEMSDEEGAILVDACATSFHAVRRAHIEPGDTVAIFGLGGLGLNGVQFARLTTGARIIGVDTQQYKMDVARELGADALIHANDPDFDNQIESLTNGVGVDIAIDFSGESNAIEKAVSVVRTGGRAVIAGCAGKPWRVGGVRCCLDEVDILGSHGFTHGEILKIVELVEQGTVNFGRIVTHKIPLEDVNFAMDLLRDVELARREKPLRIVLRV